MLKNKKNVSEFKLAEKLGVTVNAVRNMLYRMHEHNLVSHTRKKDKQKGWYIYYWTFNTKQAKSLLLDLKRKKLNKLRNKLKTEKDEDFYFCDNGCIRINSERALDIDYRCPECGIILLQQEHNGYVEEIENEIQTLEEDLKQAN